jgi:hypothetical protein
MKNEWDSIDEAVLSPERSDQLFNVIKSKIIERFQLRQWFRNIAAAAVIFIPIVLLSRVAGEKQQVYPIFSDALVYKNILL